MMTGLLSAQLAQQAEIVERAIARKYAGPLVKIDRDVMRDLEKNLKRLSRACVELEDAFDTLSIRDAKRPSVFPEEHW